MVSERNGHEKKYAGIDGNDEKSALYEEYLTINRDEISRSFVKIDRALGTLLADKAMKKADVIARSGVEVHYAYQIFSGAKVPTRDKVLMLCFGFGLTAEETQELLKITGYPQLYSKNQRDNAILFGLTKKLTMIEMNNLLYDLDVEILT